MKSPITPLILLTAAPALAQNLLDPLVVSATRTNRSASDTAYSTATIDADFIRETSRRTLPEALQYTPGVFVQKTAHGHGSPIIRGFTGRQNLLLVDGVRLNNSSWRSGAVQYWNTVDALSLDRLELIKNQGSVLYGSDAIGGTLNALTKSSDFKNRAEGQFYQAGSASYEFRANGQGSHIGRLETETGIGGKFGVMLGLSAKDFGDIEDSSVGRMHGTGYREQDLDLRADWTVKPDSTLTFYHSQVNQDEISRWHRTRNNPGWTHGSHVATKGEWTSNTYDQERSLSYLRYSGENADNSATIQRWNATLSYQTSADSEFQNRNPKEDSLRESNIDLDTTGIDLMLESKIGPGNLVYGLDYYHDSIDSSGSKNNQAGTNYSELLPIGDDSNYDLLGIYSQYEWQATEPLEITGGLRYTYADAS
ncbi:MAG: TonB-dependent receptor plug domain-containing protein, partial [Verrucomicrobiota bacterium]